jgi:hypothetical protein
VNRSDLSPSLRQVTETLQRSGPIRIVQGIHFWDTFIIMCAVVVGGHDNVMRMLTLTSGTRYL